MVKLYLLSFYSFGNCWNCKSRFLIVIMIMMDKIGRGRYWKYFLRNNRMSKIMIVEKILLRVDFVFMVFSKIVWGGVM